MAAVNMKTRPLATEVDDASIIFGAKDGQSDSTPEPFSVATLRAFIATKVAEANAGNLPVRYDATQPETDCLWVAPSGQVVLITGSP